MKKAASVDDYVSMFSGEAGEKLKQLRAVIRSVAPEAEEKISYGMPYYQYKGRLVYFAAAKQHIGVYALFPDEHTLKHELKGYSTSKGTIRFPLGKPLPVALIKKLITSRKRKLDIEADTA